MTEDKKYLPEVADKIIQARAGGKVKRCHSFTTIGEYNVAEHSWGVAMLMYQLFPTDYPRLSIYCLTHDIPEAWIGDIPSPALKYAPDCVKKHFMDMENKLFTSLDLPNHNDLPELDKKKLLACDILEFYLWAREQLEMGNRYVEEALRELDSYFEREPLYGIAGDVVKGLACVLPRRSGIMERLV